MSCWGRGVDAMVRTPLRHVLFYNDSNEFGGHEVLTLEAAKYLLDAGMRIGFMFFPGNKRLADSLTAIKRSRTSCDLYAVDLCSRSLQGVRTLLMMSERRKLSERMLDIDPDMVLISQGTIEISSLGLVAAKAAGFKTVTYLPFAHSMSTMQAPLAFVRDLINKHYYALPERFITSSVRMKELLIGHKIASDRVSIAYNGIDLSRLKEGDRSSLRSHHGINGDETVVGIVGRVLFKQKGHDLLIDAISRSRDELNSVKLVVIGDGPDRKELERLVEMKGVAGMVHFIPWQSDPSLIYPMIDILVIASRFEGVPVVMQEAMYYRVPVVGSRIDGLEEFLPPDWTFTPGNGDSLVDTLRRIMRGFDIRLLETNRAFVEREFSLDKFGSSFHEALTRTFD